MTVEQLARQMYETQANRVIPPWESLSGGTLSLWLERARRVQAQPEMFTAELSRVFGDLA